MKKTALVTGGSGGIGSEICVKLAADGWNTAVCYNSSRGSAEETVKRISEFGGCAKSFHCDISSNNSIKRCVSQVKEEYGDISLLVNNGGIADIDLFTHITDERMCELINVNLLGAMRLSREVLPSMIYCHSGAIINISSVWGECGASCEVAYSAAKAGIIGFTKALAREVAPSGIRVNCVSCGLIDTKMNSELSAEELNAVIEDIPAGRMGTPSDAAEAVRFLASENSAYIQGQVLRVDGCWI
ncbi:MAG: 3-oxoacyl-ACP reductase FabG [Ruminococcus sp.]|nr:3-oxoacyl-ACP reductase FabG [Ruminococcus sp.]